MHHLRQTLPPSLLQAPLPHKAHGASRQHRRSHGPALVFRGLSHRRSNMHSFPQALGANYPRWMHRFGKILLRLADSEYSY